MVSCEKSKLHPHHVMVSPSCAFFQLMGGVDACEQCYEDADPVWEIFMQKLKKVVYIPPAAMANVTCYAMKDAMHETSQSGPPVCRKFCTEVAHCVVVHAVFYFKKDCALLILLDFNCPMCRLEVQCDALPGTILVAMLE